MNGVKALIKCYKSLPKGDREKIAASLIEVPEAWLRREIESLHKEYGRLIASIQGEVFDSKAHQINMKLFDASSTGTS